MVAGLDLGDSRAHLHHNAGRLVPRHHRQLHLGEALGVAEVAVTVARIRVLDQGFALLGRIELQFLEAVALVDLPKDGGFDLHVLPPWVA